MMREPDGGAMLPAEFFGEDGKLLPAPWRYAGTVIMASRDDAKKEVRIVVPSEACTTLDDGQIVQLLVAIDMLRAAFERVVPPEWKVVS